MGFSEWNRRLLENYFGDFAAGQQVRLAISREVLDVEFAALGGEREFLATVRRGPDWPVHFDEHLQQWLQPPSLFERAYGLYKQWRRFSARHRDYIDAPYEAPPYLPYLCLFCFAWTIGDEALAGHNFYDRLETAYPGHALSQQMGHLFVLWEGLREWSDRYNGRLGIFRVDQLGGMQNVGIPKAQVVITASKVENLPLLFARIGLCPNHSYTPDELRTLLLGHQAIAQQVLGRTILEALVSGNAIGQAALLQIHQYAVEWDGEVSSTLIRLPGAGTDHNSRHGTPTELAGDITLALIPSEHTEEWTTAVFAHLEALPSGRIEFAHGRVRCAAHLVDSAAGPFTEISSQQLLGGEFVAEAKHEATIEALWTDEMDGARRVILRYGPKPLRVFKWLGPILVEYSRLGNVP